jgi:hypothetical protein
MSDLTSGRYPDTYEEWLLDGSPAQPYRRSISRWDIVSAGVAMTAATVFVIPVVVQQGDVIDYISIGVKTASATPTHGWAALYTGTSAAATLIAQSADDTSGFHGPGALQKFALATGYTVGGHTGTTGTEGPLVLGVALYNSALTGGVLDGMSGSSVAGAVIVSGQVPLVSTVALAATAAAPATLAGAAAAVSGVPYVALSRT